MERLDGVQDYQIDTDDKEDPLYDNIQITAEARNTENKERQNTNTIPRWENAGKVVDRPGMKIGGKKYYTQLTNTGRKSKQFMHDMKKIAVDVTFTIIIAKKRIKRHRKQEVSDMYKD